MRLKGNPFDLRNPGVIVENIDPQEMKGFEMSDQKMRDMFESGELTWADLLEITGLPAHVLYSILDDLI